MYDKILLPVDTSHELNVGAARHALVLAECFEAKIFVVHVVSSRERSRGSEGKDGHPEPIRKMQVFFDETVHGVRVDFITATGDVVDSLCELVEQLECDLIVMQTRNRSSLSRAALGSVTEKTVSKSPCPVLTMTEGTELPPTFPRTP